MIYCQFEQIGRTRDLTLTLDLNPKEPRFLDEVASFVRRHVMSSDPTIWIYATGDAQSGTITIEGGRSGSGTWALTPPAAPATGSAPTPTVSAATIANWGSDHWSTFAYIDTRCVDYGGVLNDQHLRGHLGRRPVKYPTRLKHGGMPGHDDYDCIIDLADAGLITISDDDAFYRWGGGRGTARSAGLHVAMTPLGSVVAGKLREHKAAGYSFRTFDPGPNLGMMIRTDHKAGQR